MLEVICTVAVMMSNGYRDYPRLHGIVVRGAGDTYMLVDFSEEFKKRKINTNINVTRIGHEGGPARVIEYAQTPVQRIESNDCLFVNPPKEWLK